LQQQQWRPLLLVFSCRVTLRLSVLQILSVDVRTKRAYHVELPRWSQFNHHLAHHPHLHLLLPITGAFAALKSYYSLALLVYPTSVVCHQHTKQLRKSLAINRTGIASPESAAPNQHQVIWLFKDCSVSMTNSWYHSSGKLTMYILLMPTLISTWKPDN
jgi:hypothetical protein